MNFTRETFHEHVMPLMERCHTQAVEMGWWTDLQTGESLLGRRDWHEMIILMHSEISEAVEAWRKNLMDDHLPQYPGVVVELADCMIRIFDTLGVEERSLESKEWCVKCLIESDFDFDLGTDRGAPPSTASRFADIHRTLAMSAAKNNPYPLYEALGLCVELAEALGHANLGEVIDAKLRYNRERVDHKIENRRKDGGKKI